MMEGLLRRDLGILGASVEVISAGLLDWDQAVDPQAAAVMAERGVDIAGHRSRPISTIDLHTLDLVITMTREHAREVVLGLPEVYRRTFTVKDFARRIDAEPAGEPGEDLRTRMSALSSGRALSSLMGISEEDDVADPYGLTPMHFEATADLLSVLSERISLALLTLTR
jgi:protein-tyrosine phosphatase